eukprot:1200052-Pleurochrysis_carterae.AAC.1
MTLNAKGNGGPKDSDCQCSAGIASFLTRPRDLTLKLPPDVGVNHASLKRSVQWNTIDIEPAIF